jgi:hypothetical protein
MGCDHDLVVARSPDRATCSTEGRLALTSACKRQETFGQHLVRGREIRAPLNSPVLPVLSIVR